MRFKKVLLIKPDYPTSNFNQHRSRYIPAGLGYLAQTLKQNNILHQVIDIDYFHTMEDLRNCIETFRPDLVGLSMMSFQYKNSFRILEYVRNIDQDIKIVVGGPHVSVHRKEILETCSAVDYAVIMEGEQTLLDLCRGKPISEISGIIYRDKNTIVDNGQSGFINKLDEVPFPAYDGFDIDRYIKSEIAIPIVSSRGCPYDCIYCPVILAIGKRFRMRSPANVVDEIEHWYNKGIREFGFVDDNFTLVRSRVLEICLEIERRGLTGLRLMCANGVRADRVDYELLKKMKDVGFYRLAFGVEAGTDRILKKLNKGESIDQIKKAIGWACELDYEVVLFLLVGSPTETMDDIKESIKITEQFPIAQANFYNIIPYPKTKLYEWVTSKGYMISTPDKYLNSSSLFDGNPLFYTPELSLKDRIRALKMTRRASVMVNKRTYLKRFKNKGIFFRILIAVYYLNLIQKLTRNTAIRKMLSLDTLATKIKRPV